MIRRLLRRSSLALQIVIILALSELAFQAAFAISTHGLDSASDLRCDSTRLNGFAHAVMVIDSMSSESRVDQLKALREAFPSAEVQFLDPHTRVRVPSPDNEIARTLSSVLGNDNPVLLPLDPAAPEGRVLVRLDDKSLVAATLPCDPRPQAFSYDHLFHGAFYGLIILPLLFFWLRKSVGSPLRRFDLVASDLAQTLEPLPLRPEGPAEVRNAVLTLNAASERIRNLVSERQRMLGAVTHDLLTPLTRMRLRAEFIDDDELKGQMAHDIDQMSAVTEATLRYLAEGRSPRNPSRVDLPTVLVSVVDEYADEGKAAFYRGPDHLIVEADPARIKRAVSNLVDNAVKYASRAEISLQVEDRHVVIEVLDDGPGIPDSEKSLMLEPFMKGDKARPVDGSGFGLGLSIAKTIAEQHSGTLSLLDGSPHGLRARLSFPYVDPAPGPSQEPTQSRATWQPIKPASK